MPYDSAAAPRSAALRGPRLDLVPLGLEVLAALAAGDVVGAQARLPFAITPAWAESVPAARRHAQIVADRSVAPWLARAMVLRSERRAVGCVGCHDRPDARGRVELGYQVLEGDRRRGYAREAVETLLAWARTRGATGLVLSISPDNVPSLRFAASLGLHRTGEQMDEIDGLEHVFEASLPLTSRRA